MHTKKTLLAALLFAAGTAFAYEDVTDLSGATEPPKGPADDSFVGDNRPGNTGRSGGEATGSAVTSPGAATQGTSGQQQASGSQSPSESQSGADSQAALFEQLDADRDGNVSQYEVRTHNELIQSFNEVDQDNDGVLSADELNNWQGFEKQGER